MLRQQMLSGESAEPNTEQAKLIHLALNKLEPLRFQIDFK